MSSYSKASDIHWRPHSKKNDSLPLYYKEKPKNSNFRSADSFSNQILSFWYDKQKRKMLYKAFSLSFVVYIIYYLFFSSSSGPTSKLNILDAKAKQNQIREVSRESFADYKKHAWGKDVYHPVSKSGENMGPKPLGWMIVDSLDTLYLMNLTSEIKDAKKWVKDDLTYDFDYAVNTFETTIRMLGGLLSAYYLSKDDVYLNKATDLGNRILGAFDSPSGVPYASVNLKTGRGIKSHADGGASSTAEATTLQLEFKYLAKLTGEAMYWEKVEKAMEVIYNENNPTDGLVPIFVHPDNGKFRGNLIRLGSRGDSYYEYLLKQYLQTKEGIYWQMYKESVDGVRKHLVKKSEPNKLTFIGELENGLNGFFSSKMDHLVCFYGGLLALGATEGLDVATFKKQNSWTSSRNADLQLGKELTKACYKMYNLTETGLAPEIVVFNEDPSKKKDFHIKPADTHNLQRPETVESLFILYRITKDPIYRQWGWEIFENFVKYTKVPNGSYSSLDDVTDADNIHFRDNMESFWLAETLKYLYLLFEDDESVLPLNKIVFNTEAHPLPVFDPEPLFKTGWTFKNNAKGINIEHTLEFTNSRADEHAQWNKLMNEKGAKGESFNEKVQKSEEQQEQKKNAKLFDEDVAGKQADEKKAEAEEAEEARLKEKFIEEQKDIHKDIKDAPAAAPAAKPLEEQLKEEIASEEGKDMIQEGKDKYSSKSAKADAKRKEKLTDDEKTNQRIKQELEEGKEYTEIIDELIKEEEKNRKD